MRWTACGLVAFASLLLAAPGIAASKKDHDDCNKRGSEAAIAACTRVVNDRKESPHRRAVAYFNRGLTWQQTKGDFERAFADYTEAIQLDPNDARPYFNRGLLLYLRKDYDRAIAEYTEVIRLDPKDAAVYFFRGDAWFRKKRYDNAIADYGEAARRDPKHAAAHGMLCWTRAIAGRELQQALTDCDAALRLRADDTAAMDNRGLIYLRLSRLDDAVAAYDAALKISPKQVNSLYGRGLAKLKKGDTAGGNADIAAAKAIQADIAEEFAEYGVRP